MSLGRLRSPYRCCVDECVRGRGLVRPWRVWATAAGRFRKPAPEHRSAESSSGRHSAHGLRVLLPRPNRLQGGCSVPPPGRSRSRRKGGRRCRPAAARGRGRDRARRGCAARDAPGVGSRSAGRDRVGCEAFPPERIMTQLHVPRCWMGIAIAQKSAIGLMGEPVPPVMRRGAAMNRNSHRPLRSHAARRSSNWR